MSAEGSGGAWLEDLRQKAWEAYHDTPEPGRSAHLWRYTDPGLFRMPEQILDAEPRPGLIVPEGDIPAGSRVHGAVDWGQRLWNMRRHSAEHLLTGLIEVLGEPPKVISDLERLEYQPSNLTVEQIRGVERRFNEIVDEDVPVRVYYEERARIDASGDPRKMSFLQKIPRNVDRLRMVDIGSYASTFCFGTHVESTKEIGRLSELRLEDAKKGKKVIHFSLQPGPG